MKNVLALFTSINPGQSHSTTVVESFLQKIESTDSTANVIRRDLNTDALPHLSASEMAAWMTPESERDDNAQSLALLSDSLINELKQADTIVLGLPMYNFGVPSTFKAWIDRIARAGITFRYTEQGPEGLLNGKRVLVVATRGGMYAGTEKDSQSQFIKDVFNFIGISKVDFVYLEGLAMGEDNVTEQYAQAEQNFSELMNQIAA